MTKTKGKKTSVLVIACLWSLTAALPLRAQGTRTDSAISYLERGNSHYQKGDIDRALADFNLAVASDPRLDSAWYNRAVARYDLHDWDGALMDLDNAIKLNPRYVMAWIKRGNLRMNQDAYDEAIVDYSQAIKLDPKSVMAWNNRGLARQNKRDFDAALGDYARALELDPRLPGALNNRAGIKHDRGDLRGALEDYNRALTIAPQLALLYSNRGLTRKALGDLQGAISDYTEAIRLRPNFSLAYFNRSAAWKAMGKGFEAEQDFIRSRTLGQTAEGESALVPEPGIEKISFTTPAAAPAQSGAAETPEMHLCKLVPQAKEYNGKTVRVTGNVQPVYFGDTLAALILSSQECESIEVLFDRSEDEEAVLRRLGTGRIAELPVIATGIFHSDQHANYGPFGVLSHLLLIKSYEIRQPPAQAGKRSKL